MTRQQFGERALDVGKGKYWPNFFTETFAMKKRLLLKIAQQTGNRQELDIYSSC